MFKSRYFTVGLILFVAFLGLSLIHLQQPINSLNAEIDHVGQKLTEVEQKNEDLSRNVDYLNNESYIERQLRLKLNYKKSDEEAVMIYKTQSVPQQSESSNFFIKEYREFSNWLKNIF